MKDEKYRALTLSDITDETPKKANKAGTQFKVFCPECRDLHRHRSLQYDTRRGIYYCFYCGLHGPISIPQDGTAPASATPASAPGKPAPSVRPRHASTPREALADGDARLTDYVSLPQETLDTITDISLDPQDQSPQQETVRKYLAEQQIPLEWAHRMRWGVATVSIRTKDEDQPTLRTCLAYRNYVEGICCNVKFRTVSRVTHNVNRQGTLVAVSQVEKGFSQESSFTPCAPYNIDCLRPSSTGPQPGPASRLIITEGEKDCLTLRLLGFEHVISVSNGAQTNPEQSFEAFRSWLEPFRTVVICGDKDRPGRQMVARLAAYFDDREVMVADWDQRHFGKDISELYQRWGEEKAREMVLHAEPVVRQDIIDCSSPEDLERICLLGCDPDRSDKYSVGIGPLTDRHLMLTPEGGLIIVTGTPNTGKTDWLNFLTTRLMAMRGSGVCYCSFETPNKLRHMARLAQLWIGPTAARTLPREQHQEYVRRVVQRGHHLVMRRERPTAGNILRKAEAVMRQHPEVEYLVIDPYLYMDLGRGRGVTETEAIKEMLSLVQEWAQDHRVWVFIVAHPRKLKKEDGTDEFERIDMYTIAGSANWANMADFILSLERVRKEEGQLEYTRLDVLKVRDQDVCVPGSVLYQRQPCGRYDERESLLACKQHAGGTDVLPWPLDGDETTLGL